MAKHIVTVKQADGGIEHHKPDRVALNPAGWLSCIWPNSTLKFPPDRVVSWEEVKEE